ncbi:hypothetical protein [Janthinobacterium sp. CG_S6]|uniref:hypothetical protein n=1 Tax=Janthinobacterium sp. CG_S6 TaxID=3071707 RepID=UPI002DFAA8CC|nr:DNA-binding transcriptional regulator YdaS (Cro superfamily) [Janthinobacterium sp. CG_S6]
MSEVNIAPEKVIELLGGNAKTAALCEVTPGAVSQWIHNGIPKAQLKFLKLARPDVFKAQPAAPAQ